MSERPVDPTDADVLRAVLDLERLDFHTALPARVERYDGARQVADVQPLVRAPVPRADGEHDHERLPLVPSVPVVFPRVAGWFLAFGVQPGDTGLLVSCEAAIGPWRAGDGGEADPGDLRRHHLSHAVFIPGLFTRAGALTQAPRATGAGGTHAPADAALVMGSDAADGPRLTFRRNGDVEVAAEGRVVIRSGSAARVEMQDATQSFVRGDAYADALTLFLTALATFVVAVGTAFAGVGTYAAGLAAPMGPLPTSATLATALGTVLTTFGGAATAFGSAITTFNNARTAYLSSRIKGT
jgi:hypothetical protein